MLKTPAPAVSDARPSWRVVLGLASPESDAWNPVRLAQLAALFRVQPLWLGANLASVAVLAALLGRITSTPRLAAWVVATLVVIALAVAGRMRERDLLARGEGGATMLSCAIHALLLGACWGIAPLCFAGSGDARQNLALAFLSAAAIGGAGAVLSPVPAAALVFMLAAGGGLVAMMVEAGLPVLGGAALVYTVAMALGCIANARAEMQRLRAERNLAERDEMVSLVLREFEESGADWLWQVDGARRLVNVSGHVARAFRAEPAQLEGHAFLQLLAGAGWESGNVPDGVRVLSERFRQRENFSDVIVPVPLGDETRWWKLSGAPRVNGRGDVLGFWGVGSDVTEQRRSAEKIDRMARFDTLTGLANRAQVTQTLADALVRSHREGMRAALLLIDLDRFKQVNDTLGHPIGDRLLQQVAGRLRALGRAHDICGRLGGDEFAFVIDDARDPSVIERMAERILVALGTPFEIEGHIIHIGGSVGSAVAPRDGRSPDMLLRNADLALYRAKDDGRGVHRRYEQRLHAAAQERRTIEAGLREAIERGQFHMVYQPIVDAGEGGIRGFEALLRWTHPQLGVVEPSRFVPIAEEARLIGPIGEWVIRTACQDAAGWPEHVRVAINMSPEQLADPNLVGTIVSALSHSGLAPERLELEVTEAALMAGEAIAATRIDGIRALGVRVALDDFGTGQSALGHLSKGRFSSVKIDRSFVRGACETGEAGETGAADEGTAIIRAVVALAQSLGMTTVAEGAETDAEFRRVQELGCGQVQGWLVGQPVPAAEARELAQGAAARKVA